MRTSSWAPTFGVYSTRTLWLAGGFACLKWAWVLFPLVEETVLPFLTIFTFSALLLPQIKVRKGNLSLFTPWRHTGVRTATSPHILNLGTKWGQVVYFTPQLLYSLGKNPGTHWMGHWVGPSTDLASLTGIWAISVFGAQKKYLKYIFTTNYFTN